MPISARLALSTLLLALVAPFSALALPATSELPPALQSWQAWVLAQHPEQACAFLPEQPSQRHCRWPGQLTLQVAADGARFNQHWELTAHGWVLLPGDRDHWPQQVTVNGAPAAVLNREGRPALYLERGTYQLAGVIDWVTPPQALPVPEETALLALSVDGEAVAWPQREGERLWLRARQDATGASGDLVEAQVFRLLSDDIPRRLDTVVRLSIAGKPRELRMGRLLLADTEVEHFESPLPARIEPDGSLRLQVRPGTWEVRLRARIQGDRNRFTIAPDQAHWPRQEIWSFAARPALRRVTLAGAASLDPSQLDLPAGFASLPTYLMEPASELLLTEQLRGDAAPAAHELTLSRSVWLDIDGGGATVRDRIDGTLHQGWRLQAQPALQLGRISVNGEPQLVTRLDADGPAGIELRQRRVTIDAVSRVDTLAGLDAVAWQSDFSRVDWQLQLPPGWKLWHVSGPDRVDRSWLSQWDLWDIFLALLLVGAAQRLLGWPAAALAALSVLLAWQEPGSPLLWLLPLLALAALLAWLPESALRRWLLRGSGLLALAVVLMLIGFAVEQVRLAIYPQLEQPHAIAGASPSEPPAPADASDVSLEEIVVTAQKRSKSYISAPVSQAPPRYQPMANVQTGPGIPAWRWQEVQLGWSGPVQVGQPVQLLMTGAALTQLLRIAAVLLMTALLWLVLRRLWQLRNGSPGSDAGNHAGKNIMATAPILTLTMGVLLWMSPTPAQASAFPPPELLQQLEERLLRVPPCTPDCAALESVRVELQGDRLRLWLRLGVAAEVALPLPHSPQWQPQALVLDGVRRDALLRQREMLLVPLQPGRHELLLEGVVAGDNMALQFPLPAHNVAVDAEKWEVAGLSGRRLAANSLQLQRRQRSTGRDTLLPETPPAFVEVRRKLHFDLDWRVTTQVLRVAPEQGAIALRLPLLPGESVVSDGIAVRDREVSVNLGARERSVEWSSVLPRGDQLVLTAPEHGNWVEQWSLQAAPRWHVKASGLPPIRATAAGDELFNWRPWPGESLTLTLQQPQPVSGATTTVEAASLRLIPGARGAEAVLELRIASSVGGDFAIALGEPGELRSARLNGNDVTRASPDAELSLPLVPGRNHAEVRWQLARGAALITRSPQLALAAPAANLSLELELPRDRWPLWVSGPRIGPAMLYWGVLLVMLALALALAALVRRRQLSLPLGPVQWLLLALGLSTVNVGASLLVVLWLFAMEARARVAMPRTEFAFNLVQLGLALLSVIALAMLVAVIPQSLLAAPDMQVTGNGSHNYFYQWYQDHSDGQLPRAGVFSLPLWVYRIAMLGWSLWLVFALLQWIPWGWRAFARGGLWRTRPSAPAAASQPVIDPPAADQPTSDGKEKT